MNLEDLTLKEVVAIGVLIALLVAADWMINALVR